LQSATLALASTPVFAACDPGEIVIKFLFLAIATYVPTVSTWLPNTLMGPEVITR
jgi:hypothetical protein